MTKITKRVAVLGDCHFPFQDKAALSKALVIIKDFKPDMVIQVGDLYDMFGYSKYAKSVNVLTPQEESIRARAGAEEMWKSVRKSCPKSRLVQLCGNHDERITKRILEKSPEHDYIASAHLAGLMSFPTVETIHDAKEEFVYDGVCYMHGFRKFGEHAVFNQMNTVTGHLHRAGLQYNENINGTYFELNVGWLGDKKTPAFAYRSQNKISKTTLGIGLIDKMGPRFVEL